MTSNRDATKMVARRRNQIKLDRRLLAITCQRCGEIGLWKVYKTDGGTRYIKCRCCGHPQKTHIKLE